MKTWFMAAVMLAALPASAGNVWIALHDGTHELVTELGPEGPVTALTHAHTTLFGESSTQIALVSYDNATAQSLFRLIDKQTRQLLATWPVPTTPVALLSGAAPDIVLGPDTAYLLTHAGTLTPGSAYTRNARGGGFNVVRSALRTGDTQVLPLGDAFANPRLSDFEGVPVVTDWAGYSVWRLAPDGKEMISVISRERLLDIVPAERAQREHRTLPYAARADYVVVPGAGVFRMSIFGVLQRVADSRLVALPPPLASLALGPAQDKERLLAVKSAQGPAIAVVRREQGKRILAFVDAAKLTVMWQRELPPGTSAWSMVAADADAVIYIDTEKAALMKTSRDGTAKLRELPASPRFSSAHVLSAGVP